MKKKRNKRMRYLKYQSHLNALWEKKKSSLFPPVKYVDCIRVKGEWQKRKVPYLKRITPKHGGVAERYYKKVANRRVRHYKGGISRGGNYLIISGTLVEEVIWKRRLQWQN